VFGNYYTLQGEMEEADRRRRRAHLTAVRARLRLQERVEQLEDDLARVGLVTMALAKLCIDKGVLTLDELNVRMSEVDIADGVEDGKATSDAMEPGGGAAS
jgi:hypothetical protein